MPINYEENDISNLYVTLETVKGRGRHQRKFTDTYTVTGIRIADGGKQPTFRINGNSPERTVKIKISKDAIAALTEAAQKVEGILKMTIDMTGDFNNQSPGLKIETAHDQVTAADVRDALGAISSIFDAAGLRHGIAHDIRLRTRPNVHETPMTVTDNDQIGIMPEYLDFTFR